MVYATVAEIKAILPSNVSLTNSEIQSLLDTAALDTSDDHMLHFNRTMQLVVSKLKMMGQLPDSATVGPLKSDINYSKMLDVLSNRSNLTKLPFMYYNRSGGNRSE